MQTLETQPRLTVANARQRARELECECLAHVVKADEAERVEEGNEQNWPCAAEIDGVVGMVLREAEVELQPVCSPDLGMVDVGEVLEVEDTAPEPLWMRRWAENNIKGRSLLDEDCAVVGVAAVVGRFFLLCKIESSGPDRSRSMKCLQGSRKDYICCSCWVLDELRSPGQRAAGIIDLG